MSEHPVHQSFVGLLDVRLENGQHRVGHAAVQGVLPVFVALLALAALRIVLLQELILELCRLIGQRKGRLHREAPGATDQIVAMQEVQRVVKALLAERGQDFRPRGKQDPSEAVHVLLGQLDAGVGPIDVEHLGAVVAGADVRLAAEGAHGDGVFVQGGQIVREGSVHVAYAVEAGRQNAGKYRDEARAEQGLEEGKGRDMR